MNEAVSDIIAEINQQATPKVLTVSIDDVKRKAAAMAARGYLFDERTFGYVRHLCLGRGVMMIGDVGTGKSFFFQCAGIPCLNLKIAQGKTIAEIANALDEHRNEAVLVDDLGVEEVEYKSFGTSVRLLDFILERRNDSPAPTHFTTNLTIAQLAERYGDRALDRIRGMAVLCEMRGESKRNALAGRRHGNWYAEFYLPRVWRLCADKCPFYDYDERRCIKGKTVEPQAGSRRGYDPEPICPYYS